MKYYDGILERVRKIEEKNAIFYAKPGGKLYNVLRICYLVSVLWGLLSTFIFLMGVIITYRGFLAEFYMDILTPAVCALLIIAAAVLMIKKIHVVSAVLNTVPSVILIFFFRNRLIDEFSINSVYPKYYWRHFAPLMAGLILGIWLAVIAVRAGMKLKSQYIRVTENLYNLYKVRVSDGGELTEEQWEEFLKRYDPNNYGKQFDGAQEKEEKSEG